GEINERLPSGEGDERNCGSLMEGQRGWFEGDVILVDRDVLREGPDAEVARARVDLVADLEPADGGADLRHHPGEIVAEHERLLVSQELLELAVADHLVQRVDARRADLDQDVTVADLRP